MKKKSEEDEIEKERVRKKRVYCDTILLLFLIRYVTAWSKNSDDPRNNIIIL